MKRIYLDYAATTPIDLRVAKAMRNFELKYFGNPSSVHLEGQRARAEIDFARAAVGRFLNCQPQEIIFTSGATEANNHAIKGAISSAIFNLGFKPHVVTTHLEHHSVFNTVKEMERRGVIEATFIKPNRQGLIKPDQVVAEIRDNTVLVSTIFVSNEIGTILPVREIGKLLSTVNHQLTTNRRVLYHVDAVQAVKFFNCNVEKLGCDLLTVSAHKINGPKGIGALFVKSGVKIDNLMSGGSQEYGLRPGTQNSAGIIGLAKSLELLGSLEGRQASGVKIKKMRDKLLQFFERLDDLEINGPIGDERSPENLSLTLYDIDQDALMTALDLAGIAVSTGSACVSGSSQPSHVIQALGKVAADRDAATVRLTLGKTTTNKEINATIKIFPEIIEKLKSKKTASF